MQEEGEVGPAASKGALSSRRRAPTICQDLPGGLLAQGPCLQRPPSPSFGAARQGLDALLILWKPESQTQRSEQRAFGPYAFGMRIKARVRAGFFFSSLETPPVHPCAAPLWIFGGVPLWASGGEQCTWEGRTGLSGLCFPREELGRASGAGVASGRGSGDWELWGWQCREPQWWELGASVSSLSFVL